MGKLKKSLLISLCALFVAAIAVFGILHMNFAHAAEVSVTVQSDGNGNVSAKGQSGEQITISAEQGSSVEITASPTEGYVFAYWYENADTPLSYDEVYSYTIPAAETTLHAKFFEKDSGMIFTEVGDGWSSAAESGTHIIKSDEGAYNFKSNQKFYIYVEFYGEKYFSFDILATTEFSDKGSINVYMDGYQYEDTSCTDETLSIAIRANSDKYHRIVILYTAPYFYNNPVPQSLSVKYSNFQVRDDSAFQKVSQTIKFDDKLCELYFIEGVSYKAAHNGLKSELLSISNNPDVVKKVGKIIESHDGEGTITVAENVSTTIYAFPKTLTSTIDPRQQVVGVYHGFLFDGEGNKGNSDGELSIHICKTDGQNNIYVEGTSGATAYSVNEFEVSFKEKASLPVLSITKTINGVQDTITPENNEKFTLNYGQTNNFLFAIEQSPTKKEVAGEEFNITVNGKPLGSTEDTGEGTGKNGYTFVDGKYGFNLVNITLNTVVVITPNYNGDYDTTPFTYTISMASPNNDLQDAISQGSKPITVTNDVTYPWFFDPQYNGEDGTFAYSAGNSNLVSSGNLQSEIVFDVSQNTATDAGTLQFEFKIDGGYAVASSKDTIYSQAYYNIDSPVQLESLWTWSTKPPKKGTVFAQGNQGDTPKLFAGAKASENEGWYKIEIPVNQNAQKVYLKYGGSYYYKYEINYFVIRNVIFVQGKTNLSWEIQDSTDTKQDAYGKISATVGGVEKQPGEFSAGATVNFSISTDKKFYCWKNSEGKILSFEPTLSYAAPVGATEKIIAVIDEPGTYAVRNNNKFYKTDEVQTALNDAERETDKNVVVVDNVSLNQIKVPAGVNLVIPFNRVGDYYTVGTTSNAQERVSWATSGIYKDPVYTITLNGENTLYGNLIVGGVLHYPDQSAQGHTSGKYSQLILNGNISVESGGHLDVYGRVTGNGAIDVKSGGKLSQPFMITDYNGGTNTEASFNKGITPFKMYAMVNVQNKGGFTIHYGAELYGHASLYFLSSITTIDAPFISYVEKHDGGKDYFKNPALIILNDDAQAHVVYDDKNYDTTENGQHKRVVMKAGDNTQDVGFTKIEITGNAYAGYMQFPMSINTTKVYFSVPYNYDITLKSGQFDILYPYKLMPGASFTVDKEATLVVRSEAGLQVYDSFYGPEVEKRAYPTGAQLIAAGYKPYANFVVNGTLDIKDNAHFVGTVQNNGTGTIKIGKGATLKEDDLFDGVATEYSCNYTKYSLVAHVWDSAHGDGEMRMLEAGKTYTAVSGDITFTLPGIEFSYENGDTKHNSSSHTLAKLTTAEAQGLKGAWKVTHTGHTFNWDSPTAEDKQFGDENFKELTHQCTELGCNEEEHKCLLKPVEIPAKDYRGNAYTAEELFKEIYKNLPGYVQFEFPQSPVMLNASESAYSFTVTITSGGYFLEDESFETSHAFEFKINKLNISQADVKGLEGLTYNGNAQTPSLTVTVNGVSAGNNVDFSVKFENNVNAGDSAQVTITGISENFTGELVKTFTIGKKSIQVNIVKPAAHTYDGKIPQISSVKGVDWAVEAGAIASQGGKEDDLKIVLSIENASKNVGQYTIKGAYTNQNYDVEFIGGESAFEITPKAITVTAENKAINYGDEEEALTWTIAEGQLATGDERSVLDSLKLTRQPGNVVNSYTISGEPKTQTIGNYTVTVTPGVYTINKKDITVTADNKTITYGDTDEKLTWSIADGELVNGDGKEVLDITLTRAEGKAATDYTISGTGTADNYNITVTPGTYTINKKDIAVTVNKQECVYNGQKQTVKSGTSFWKLKNDGSLVSGDSCDDLKITLSGEGKEVGKYAIICKSEAANYSVTFEGDTEGFEITKATITVKADDKNSHEGETLAELTVTVMGAYEHEIEEYVRSMVEITLEDGAVGGHAGDNFEISISLKSEYREPDNYTVKLSEVKGTYSITDAVFKDVKFSGGEPVTYDGESHKLTATGIPDGAEAKYLYQNEEFNGATDVGEYEITLKVTMGEFKPLELKATLKITPKAITVTAENKTIKYGDKEEALTWTIAEGQLAARDDRSVLNSLKLTRQPGNVVNSYTISGEPETQTIGNYTVTVTPGVYTINKKDITVTADNITVTYGDEEKPLTFTVPEGALVEGDHDSDLAVVLVREQGDDVRDYRITGTSTSKNYNVTVTPAIYKIEKFDISGKELTVTGLEGLVYNGSAQTPELTVKAGKLTVTFDNPEFSNNVNATENAKVTIKGNNNFTGEKEITFKISPREIKVALRAQTVVYNGEIPNPKQDEWDVKEGEICTVGDIQDNLQIVVTITSPNRNANTYGLTGESHNANYKVEVTGSTITITPKPITVTADNKTITYGDVDEKLTWSIADGELVGGDDKSILNITLTREPGADAGEYDITGPQNTQGNYTVTVTAGLYKIERRKLTVDITAESVTYNGGEQSHSGAYKVSSGEIKEGDEVSLAIEVNAKGTNVNKYSATTSYNGKNYEIEFNGKENAFTITAKSITVTIADQTSEYSGEEPVIDGTKWTEDGKIGEDDLNIILTKEEGVNAGEYDITGTCGNANYNVTWKIGTFTITKKPVTGIMVIVSDGTNDYSDSGDGVIHAKFGGQPLTISAGAPNPYQDLHVETSVTEITETGSYTVTARIVETNYSGEITVKIEVAPDLSIALERLAALKAQLSGEELTAEDFGVMKQINDLINGLAEEDRESDELNEYKELIESWNAAAGIDEEIITQANTLADEIISGIIAAISAAAAIAYVAIFGGKAI